MQKTTQTLRMLAAVAAGLAVSLSCAGQDIGFEVISEGVVEPTTPFSVTAYGSAGYSIGGAMWASAGARASLTLGEIEVYGDASGGTDGVRIKAGASMTLFGFGTSAEATIVPGGAPTFSLRALGAIDGIQLTVNGSFTVGAISLLAGGSMDLDGFGVSASLGFGGGTITAATVGANTEMGAMSLSATGGWTTGQFTLGGGLGMTLGAFNVTANAGYNSAFGINAVASAGISARSFVATAVGMFDNTGIGVETTAEMGLGATTLSAVGRFAGGNLSVEFGGRLPLGSIQLSLSVAFDNNTGLSWLEASFEMPLI